MYYKYGRDINDINIESANPNLENTLAYNRRSLKDKTNDSFNKIGRDNINVHLSK